MNETGIAAIGIALIFLMTTAGSALVFFFKKDISAKVNAAFLGFASGVMVAASVFGLLVPAMEQAENFGKFNWVPAAVGFLAGGAFLIVLDKIGPHAHEGGEHEHGVHAALKKPTKMFLAVTIHNIPEGLAVGFAFGAALAGGEMSSVYAALGLAIGIGIQNFPEGAAVSLPMKNVTGSRAKAFWYGAASGAVEPIFALIGLFLAAFLSSAMPWLLSFAAGAMIFVVAEDLIPDAKLEKSPYIGGIGVMLGFTLMMILDVALG